MFSLRKHLFRSSAHVLIGLFFLIEPYELFTYFGNNSLSVTSFTTHSVGCLFILFMVSFAMQKLLKAFKFN